MRVKMFYHSKKTSRVTYTIVSDATLCLCLIEPELTVTKNTAGLEQMNLIIMAISCDDLIQVYKSREEESKLSH